MQLVAAVASGIGVGQAIAGLSAPIPHYRFMVLLEKAKQAAQNAMQLGATLLTVLEKKDAEQLALLRSTHEQSLLKFNLTSKTDQLKVAKSALTSIEKNLNAAQQRLAHYQLLLTNGLSVKEELQVTMETEAIALNMAAQDIKGAAIEAHLIPTVFGFADGDFNPGDAINQGAMMIEGDANIISQGGQLAAGSAQNDRRAEEWLLQLENSTSEVDQLKEQLKAGQLQVKLAQAGINYLNKTMSQTAEVELFLKSKFSTQELYQWMVGRVSGLYFQTYQLAYSLAASAQTAWQYERAEHKIFIHPGAWDDLHKGLLAGETLLLDLNRMDQAYLEQDKRRFEITKTISLSQLLDKGQGDIESKSQEIVDYKDDGTTQSAFENMKTEPKGFIIEITEEDFNNDYPAHKNMTRQIKSVSVSLPTLLGPYENIHATLTQNTDSVFIEGKLKANKSRQEQIVLSHGISDTGLFETSDHDERYLPFEGSGAISSWTLEFTKLDSDQKEKAKALENLTDVILELRYTVLQ
jgi:hypothetical protein